jgi:carbonic anhydrase/acetyltransferase-like protein (isoleucine patch superfamily)
MSKLSKFTSQYLSKVPFFHDRTTNYIASSAELIGSVSIQKNVSVFPKTVLRADIQNITIGHSTNIQDGCIGHVSSQLPLIIGNECTIGHGVILHACTVQNNCLIGMRATLLDGCVIGEHSIVAAGSLVPKGKVFEPRSLIMGSPAKRIRDISDQEIVDMKNAVDKYIKVSKDHYLLQ